MLHPTGFREYDARWLWGDQVDADGMRTVGRAFASLARARGISRTVVGHDWRSCSEAVKSALVEGLVAGGMTALDVGLCLTPMAYFAQIWLDVPGVAMVTASHNPNGWTGVKVGLEPPLTFGPDDMAALKALALAGGGEGSPGGSVERVEGLAEAWIADLASRVRLDRRLKVVCACGNGTAGAFAPAALRAMGAEVIEMDCDLDWTFPRYDPNPEDREMLAEISRRVVETGADLGLGFDGDGDRCGVVDDRGEPIFADKMGLLLARGLAADHPGARFVVDVKSTGLFDTDPVLAAHGCTVDWWMTGHSHMKRRVAATGALMGFEKSGHFFPAPPLGRGYDDGVATAGLVMDLVARAGRPLSDLREDLAPAWTSLTMSPHCPDEARYEVVARLTAEFQADRAAGREILGRRIVDVATINGARVKLEDGSWLLVRASSNKPELVVVVESLRSQDDMRALFHEAVKPRLAGHPEIGAFNQEV
ncbi:phosphomannomutase/phosphoglucomutase [Brevundimonas fluminis]|jgi:phosphomannomutase/phosphoglucomutase|uniref:phosphomannomutase/phosphoglucomutase n=1 Tax=Brevundimonas fluminis TaxID=2487274 RepID=UPI000F657FF4|nr:phosphomannomutase/phosphoglucomutase [Brevundimonas fluminis]